MLQFANIVEEIQKKEKKESNAIENNNSNVSFSQNSKPSIQLEADFDPNKQEEWVSQRIVALIQDGKTASDAKIQADAEFFVKKQAYEKVNAEKNEHQKKMQDLKDKNIFVYEEHSETFNSMTHTSDLVKYLEELPITNEYFTNEILPEIKKLAEIERMYGKNIDTALKKLEELTNIEK